MGKGFTLLRRWVQAFSATVVAICVIATVWTVGPWVETHFFPVVQKLHIADLRAGEDPNTSVFTAEFVKVRDCEYLGIGWYKSGSEPERVPIVLGRGIHDTDTPNRPPGFTRTGPWTVSLPPDQVRPPFGQWVAGQKEPPSFAVLFHRCHPFWVSKTEFYP